MYETISCLCGTLVFVTLDSIESYIGSCVEISTVHTICVVARSGSIRH